MAGIIVASVLFARGVGVTKVGSVTVAALALGGIVHHVVLLLGVGVLRSRADDATGDSVKAV